MFIELHMRPKDSKDEYRKYLVNVNNIMLVNTIYNILLDDDAIEVEESYDDIRKMLDKHNLLITK